ncbi:hypothetical protein JTE90_000712 [Oedothorax gibbosus]|uniref:Medium-chain acyl-CoA ligase ACSF2, mitochondrial n=1 Tax=Oedothorax gibbosus TaxID=931172 RepID=A0AAV6UPT2_9ARAC|nr:hypothetical protein JTE90_000712 [Oedothorax gibbosus]
MNFLNVRKSVISVFKHNHLHFRSINYLQQKIKDSYYFMHGDVLLSCSTLGQVLDRSADEAGDSTAIISDFQGISKNYSQFRNEAERLASGFVSQGLRKGDRIAICSPNCYEWSLTQFAAAKAGLILVNVNPASQAKELEYFLRKVDCRAIVSWDIFKTQNFYKILCNVIPELPNSKYGKLQSKSLPNLKNVILISEQKHEGVINFKDLADSGNKESDEQLSSIEKNIQFDDPVNIIFTSGTTGAPKGATLSHHNVINNSLVMGRRIGFNLWKPVVCCHIPLFHSFGCVHGSIASVFYKGTCVFPSLGYDSVLSLKAIEKHKCTVVYGAPTLFVDMMRSYEAHNFNISSLKQACLGGAPANETLIKDIQKVLKVPQVHVGYGITETSPAVALNGINEEFENIAKGILKPVEYVEVKVIDDKNNLVPINTDGELCVRGHNVFIGYWNDTEKTSKVLDETRWYHTGDIGVMNDEGCVKIVGRKSDLIIRGGVNIYPLEIENFLNTHTAILEVHACGVPDDRLGEEVCVWISVKKDMKLSEEEIRIFCKGQISHYKVPRYIMFVEEFPKTQSGKIQKFEMTKISIKKLNL